MAVSVSQIAEDQDFGLALSLLAGSNGQSRQINHARIQKPGLALAGFASTVRPHRVQVLGRTEIDYLNGREPSERAQAIEHLMKASVDMLVITNNMAAPDGLVAEADAFKVPLFATPLSTSAFILQLHRFLDEYLSPEATIHGVLVDIYGVGMLILGPGGIGKSEAALDLILRGHLLVADDAVRIKNQAHELIATGVGSLQYHMEVRGLGIINVQDLFGAASVRRRKRVDQVVKLYDWKDQQRQPDRTGLEQATHEILGVALPRIDLPLRPGRNVASILEVAARNHMLSSQGKNSAEQFRAMYDASLRTP